MKKENSYAQVVIAATQLQYEINNVQIILSKEQGFHRALLGLDHVTAVIPGGGGRWIVMSDRPEQDERLLQAMRDVVIRFT